MVNFIDPITNFISCLVIQVHDATSKGIPVTITICCKKFWITCAKIYFTYVSPLRDTG